MVWRACAAASAPSSSRVAYSIRSISPHCGQPMEETHRQKASGSLRFSGGVCVVPSIQMAGHAPEATLKRARTATRPYRMENLPKEFTEPEA